MPGVRYVSHSKAPASDVRHLRDAIKNALAAGVLQVHTHTPSRSSVYVGKGGALLMDWKLSDFVDELPEYQANVNLASSSLSQPDSGSRASFLETSVGTAALTFAQYLRTPSLRKTQRQDACIRIIQEAIRVAINEDMNDDGCEVLYGRAGLLYAILFLRVETQAQVSRGHLSDEELNADGLIRLLGHLCSTKNIQVLANDVIARGRVGAKAYKRELRGEDRVGAPPLMWSWQGKRYLGGAHGVVGILQILISAPIEVIASFWDSIITTVEWIVGLQQPGGNWPHKASRDMQLSLHADETDELIQWCHGAPAVLILLSALVKRFGSPASTQEPINHPQLSERFEATIRTALSRGGRLVYEHGFLRKGVGLCHGVAGSVYALLAVSDALDADATSNPAPISESNSASQTRDWDLAEQTWLLRAAHLAQLAASYEQLTKRGEMSIPDRPYSLYEGVAGMCCAWAEVLRRIEGRPGAGGGMPAYDDLPHEPAV